MMIERKTIETIDLTRIAKIAKALEESRRLGTFNPILGCSSKGFIDDPIMALKPKMYKDTVYGSLMIKALQKHWRLPSQEMTIRKCVAVLFKHLRLEITPAMRTEIAKHAQVARSEMDILIRCASEIEERIGLNDPQTCYGGINEEVKVEEIPSNN